MKARIAAPILGSRGNRRDKVAPTRSRGRPLPAPSCRPEAHTMSLFRASVAHQHRAAARARYELLLVFLAIIGP
eukprot:1776091-Prymnesium_polylepis.1